jgi:hypothetical protein
VRTEAVIETGGKSILFFLRNLKPNELRPIKQSNRGKPQLAIGEKNGRYKVQRELIELPFNRTRKHNTRGINEPIDLILLFPRTEILIINPLEKSQYANANQETTPV